MVYHHLWDRGPGGLGGGRVLAGSRYSRTRRVAVRASSTPVAMKVSASVRIWDVIC
jgi:hypothetical protein